MAAKDDHHASCLLCSWAYVGNFAQDAFEHHMKEHDYKKFEGWLTLNDKTMLKRMGIRWEE